jgi:hypothetical protein
MTVTLTATLPCHRHAARRITIAIVLGGGGLRKPAIHSIGVAVSISVAS